MVVIAAYRRLAANRPLVRLLGGEFLAELGDWVYLLGLLVLVYADGGSALLLGAVGAGRIVPYVLLSVPAGYLADRFDRRRLLLAADLSRSVLMVAVTILVATDGPLALIVVLTLLAACASACVGPAVGAYLPTLVEDESQIGPANSAWASIDNVAFTLGPAIGGLLIALLPLPVTFGLTAVLFAAVAAVIRTLPSGRGLEVTQDGAMSGVPAGPDATTTGPIARAVLAPVAGLVVVETVVSFVSGGLGVLTVIVAVDVLRAGDAATGALNAALGLGGLVGAIVSGAFVLRSLAAPVAAGVVAMAAGAALLAVPGPLAAAAAGFAIASLGNLFVDVILITILQRVVPDRLLGRSVGMLMSVWAASYAAGAFVYPFIVGAVGVHAAMAASTVAIAMAGGVGLALFGRAADRPVEAPAAIVRRFAAIPALAGVPQARIERAARRAIPVRVGAAEVVVRQGDPADRFYVIDSGTFRVTQVVPGAEGERLLRTLGPGDAFGEIGLLAGVARTASVIAESDGQLLALEGPEFFALVGSGLGLSSRLLDFHRGAIGR